MTERWLNPRPVVPPRLWCTDCGGCDFTSDHRCIHCHGYSRELLPERNETKALNWRAGEIAWTCLAGRRRKKRAM